MNLLKKTSLFLFPTTSIPDNIPYLPNPHHILLYFVLFLFHLSISVFNKTNNSIRIWKKKKKPTQIYQSTNTHTNQQKLNKIHVTVDSVFCIACRDLLKCRQKCSSTTLLVKLCIVCMCIDDTMNGHSRK